MTENLLPCPFCGGEAESKMYLWGHHAETHEPIWCYYIYCTSCDAMTDNVFKSKEEAISAWNRRAQPENKPLTCDGCALHYEGVERDELCLSCKRKSRADYYRSKPEGVRDEEVL